ncbi:response regulator [Comamonas sp. Y6]|uniref:Response regulator n=1 Tax=Comamonas resistens TaxID=3046670 RepID=A0ABY8SQ81_9BURK|nr:response regulator [Comamonas resistens]MDL5035820.1 response regulator [Comamonas resistens]WHS65230.1 response regulator [Comamonas resistens]HBP0978980.1 response regulator [Pseudomonas aeruginosa]
MRILLVEDDELIASGILVGLRAHGIAAAHVLTAADAECMQQEETFDAIVLDLGLPDRDGLQLLDAIRAFEPAVPVLILSARDAIEYRLSGLHGGADDYMTKPFDLRELAARLHALVRRSQGRCVQIIEAGPLRVEPDSGLAWLSGQPVELSRREVDLLVHLANAEARWLPPDSLRERLYGFGEEIHSNALNVHIHNIRRKLGNQAIETSRGLGYRLGWRRSS